MNTYTLRTRKQIEVNTDPQRRCYYGCHAKSEMVWTRWEVLDSQVPEAKVEHTLEFWRELNDYSVSVGGKKSEYECVLNEVMV